MRLVEAAMETDLDLVFPVVAEIACVVAPGKADGKSVGRDFDADCDLKELLRSVFNWKG